MERAYYLNNFSALEKISSEYERIYLGAEFCERLLPKADILRKTIDRIVSSGKGVSLLTPFLTDAGLKQTCELILGINDLQIDFEVVVNDWGLLQWLAGTPLRCEIVLGRLLTKQKRGPRLMGLEGLVPDEVFDHFRKIGADLPILSTFYAELGIRRIELDNLLQGIERKEPRLQASLYYPYAYVTITRYCRSMYGDKNTVGYRSLGPCEKTCRKHRFILGHPTMPVPLLLRGNTQFFANPQLPENLGELKIDRLVFEADIPL